MEIFPELAPTVLLVLPFLVSLVALHLILFKPLMAYLDDREAVSGRALEEAQAYERSAAEKMDALEARLAEARGEIGALRKQARTEAQEEEATILAAARREAEAKVAQAVAEIAREQKKAASILKGTANTLSTEIAAQVLGRAAREA